jgi:hypothetical protein
VHVAQVMRVEKPAFEPVLKRLTFIHLPPPSETIAARAAGDEVGGPCSDRAPPHRLPACTVIGDDREMTFVENVDSGVPCALETLVSGSASGES